MLGPTNKYKNLQKDPIDGVPMVWGVHPDGYPIRKGDAPDIIEKERLNHATVSLFVRSETLTIPDDNQRYVEIMDWIANGAAMLRFEERKPHPTEFNKWGVWVVWVDLRGVIPKGNNLPIR